MGTIMTTRKIIKNIDSSPAWTSLMVLMTAAGNGRQCRKMISDILFLFLSVISFDPAI